MIPLLILGLLLQNRGANGYELLSLMDKGHYKYIVNYTKGSFYYNLQQLEEKQYIRILENEGGNRESNRFEITKLGQEAFNQLMVTYGTKSEYVNLSFYGALLFESAYSKENMDKLVHAQIEETEKKIKRLTKSIEEDLELSPSFRKMLENSRAHHQVNLEWFRSLLEG